MTSAFALFGFGLGLCRHRRRGSGGGTSATSGQLDFSKAANSGLLILGVI